MMTLYGVNILINGSCVSLSCNVFSGCVSINVMSLSVHIMCLLAFSLSQYNVYVCRKYNVCAGNVSDIFSYNVVMSIMCVYNLSNIFSINVMSINVSHIMSVSLSINAHNVSINGLSQCNVSMRSSLSKWRQPA